MSYISISIQTLREQPASVQQMILKVAGIGYQSGAEAVLDEVQTPENAAPTKPVALDAFQAADLVRKMHPSTIKLLKAIVACGPYTFVYRDLLKQVGVPEDEWRTVRGRWSGISKRVRTVTGIKDAELLRWNWNKNAVTSQAYIDPVSHASLRDVLANY